jgi:uncharacterized membrane protein YqjE
MVAQTKMNGATMNGAKMTGTESPSAAAGATRNASAAARDMFTLAELQLQLLSADYRESKRRLTMAVVAAMLGVLLLIAALPVALIALAAVLMNAGYSPAAAYGLAASAAVLAGGAAMLVGWLMARAAFGVFSRSWGELSKNLDSIRCLLGSHDRCTAD